MKKRLAISGFGGAFTQVSEPSEFGKFVFMVSVTDYRWQIACESSRRK